MALPVEFENELENWLRERFARHERVILRGVVEMVTAMMNEQLKLGGEVCKFELGEEFTKLQSLVAEYQRTVDRLQSLFEQMQRLDRAAPGEHSTMN
jgi:hypothetical protein